VFTYDNKNLYVDNTKLIRDSYFIRICCFSFEFRICLELRCFVCHHAS